MPTTTKMPPANTGCQVQSAISMLVFGRAAASVRMPITVSAKPGMVNK